VRHEWRQWRGPALALAVSVMLHAAFISTAGRQVRVGDASGELPRTVTAELRRAPPASPREPVHTPVHTPASIRPVAPPAAAPANPANVVPAVVRAPAPTAPPEVPVAMPAHQAVAEPSPEPPAVAPAAGETGTGSQSASTAIGFNHWPPSGTQSYRAVRSVYGYDDRKTYGVGDIRWRVDGERYRIEQDIALDLVLTSVRILAVTSEGKIGATGLQPQRYTEQARSKAPVATNFNRDESPATVTFSASTSAYPLPPDVQDRASVIFQLAAILRNSAQPFKPGDTIVLPMAGVRLLEPWTFQVGEFETVETGLGKIQAWHLTRLPHPEESNGKQVELWFAPDHEWLPVHIVHTEKNGDSIEMTARGWSAGR
jgi:hypothetical protein